MAEIEISPINDKDDIDNTKEQEIGMRIDNLVSIRSWNETSIK